MQVPSMTGEASPDRARRRSVKVTRRQVRSADRSFLVDVYASTREQELALVDWDEAQKRAFCEMQFSAQDVYYRDHYRNTTHQIVLVDGQQAGRLYVARRPDEIRIMDIALLPEFRGRGVGSALLAELRAEAAATSRPLRIHVERFNPALRLYERLGFVAIADRGVYLFLEWRPPGDAPTLSPEPST
jgi:GNAT superfamily N-acetyltransferase